MKLTRIAWALFRIPFVRPYETAHGAATHRQGFILRVDTDSGLVGLGEASLAPASPPSQALLGERIESLARAVVGRAPEECGPIMEACAEGDATGRAARCAVETAVLDASARAAGIPLARMLAGDTGGTTAGPPMCTAVRVNATVAARETEAAVAAATAAVAQGYACVKLKVGMEAGLHEEVARVAAVREAIGEGVELRIDANGAWDEARAIETLRALEPYNVRLVEQPVPAGDLEGLRNVAAAASQLIAADEAVDDLESGFRALQHADGIVLKPMRLGGPSAAVALARAAGERGAFAITTTTIDTGIATAMALHAVAALPAGGLAHGLATASLLEHDLLRAPLQVERGVMRVPEGPGLGVELDEEAAARYLGPWQEVH